MFIVATIYVVWTLVHTSKDVWTLVVGHWNQSCGLTVKLRRGTCLCIRRRTFGAFVVGR